MLNNKKNKRNKKAFTIVELVIVIAVIAILAAVLIPTFASIIKKANDSAYLQERTNQTIIDSAEEIENPDYLSWKDFEALLAKKIVAARSAEYESLKTAVASAVTELRGKETALTDKQLAAIIERTLKGELTTAMVDPIVEAVVPFDEAEVVSLSLAESAGIVTLSENDRKDIVDKVIAKLDKEIGITADEMAAAIKAVKNDADPTAALAGFKNDLTDKQIQEIIEFALGQSAGNEGENTGGNETTETSITLNKESVTLIIGKNPTVTLEATVSSEGAVSWSSSDNAVAEVDQNGNVKANSEGSATITATINGQTATCKVTVVCNHELYGATDNKDGTHTGSCFYCGKEIKEDHFYNNGVCACSDQKTYTLMCDACDDIVEGCTIDTKGTCYDSSGTKLTACPDTNGDHSGHFECHNNLGRVTCNGCLKIQRCGDEHKEYRNCVSVGSNEHRVTCDACRETYVVKHNMSNGKCTDCGQHNHNFTCAGHDLEKYTAIKKCSYSYCDFEPQVLDIKIEDENMNHHVLDCPVDNCTLFERQSHEFVDGVCTVCKHECTHDPNTCGRISIHNATTHSVACAKCNATVGSANEAHTINTVTGKCTGCGAYIFTTANQMTQAFGNLANITSETTFYITKDNLTIPQKSITVKSSLTIDLCGNTNITSKLQLSVAEGASLVIRNGSMRSDKNISLSAGTLTSKTQLTLDNVTLTGAQEGTVMSPYFRRVILGQSNTIININNSTIDMGASTSTVAMDVAAIYYNSFNNVELNITGNSAFTISEVKNANSTNLVYSKTVGSGSSITISNATTVNSSPISSDNVGDFLHDNVKSSTNTTITPTPAA